MIARLQVEYQRFFNRDVKIGMLSDQPPLVLEKIKALDATLATFADRVKTIRDYQRLLLDVLQITQAIDFSITPTTRKQTGDEQTPPEIIALRKLAASAGSSKVRRVRDGETIRVNRLDRDYNGHPGHRPGLFFFSSQPKPGVYYMPLDGIGIDPNPVYIPIDGGEKK